MHVLEPKHTKLKPDEVEKLVSDLNISLIQLPKIKVTDPALPEDSGIGEVFKIERKNEEGKTIIYYRVVSV
jgi:DNA-directed RNA polymerase subunit H